MGETDSADKFMVLVVEYFTYLFLLKQWREGYELQIGQPQVMKLMVKMSQLKS
jgi:predicted membrane GTPase involved in stress response